MAVAPLNLSPDLQAWHEAGLSFLMLERPLRDWLATLPTPQSRPVIPASGQAAASTLPPCVSPVSEILSPEKEKEDQTNTASRTNDGFAQKAAGLGMNDLPEPWKRVLRKVSPAPIAWVYPELGQDLLLQADAGRSQALRGIIAGLRLKKGSSTFWPATLPMELIDSPSASRSALLSASSLAAPGQDDHADTRNAEADNADSLTSQDRANKAHSMGQAEPGPSSRELFRFGLDHLGVKFLAALGPQSLAGTDYEHLLLRPFSEQIVDGRLVLALPGFAEILSGQAKLESVTLFLRAVFSRYFLD